MFLVAVGMLCHPALDACKVLTTTKKKLIMGKETVFSCALSMSCMARCCERRLRSQIVPSLGKTNHCMVKKEEVNNQWKAALKCVRDVAAGMQHPCVHLMRASGALLLPAGSCNPAAHTLVHSMALFSATLTTERRPTLFHGALQVLSSCFLL